MKSIILRYTKNWILSLFPDIGSLKLRIDYLLRIIICIYKYRLHLRNDNKNSKLKITSLNIINRKYHIMIAMHIVYVFMNNHIFMYQ